MNLDRKSIKVKFIIVEVRHLFFTGNWIACPDFLSGSHIFRYGSDKVGIGKIAKQNFSKVVKDVAFQLSR